MSNTNFYVPKLKEVGAWHDWRSKYKGGFGWRGDNKLSNYKYVVLHHTATPRENNAKKEVDYIDYIQMIMKFICLWNGKKGIILYQKLKHTGL